MLSPREARDATSLTQYRRPLRNRNSPTPENKKIPYLLPNLKGVTPKIRESSSKSNKLGVSMNRESNFNRSFALVKRSGEDQTKKLSPRDKKSPEGFHAAGKTVRIIPKHHLKEHSLELPSLSQNKPLPKLDTTIKRTSILINRSGFSRISDMSEPHRAMKLPQLDRKKVQIDHSWLSKFEKRQSVLNDAFGKKSLDDSRTISFNQLSPVDTSLVETLPEAESFSILLDLQKNESSILDKSFKRGDSLTRRKPNQSSSKFSSIHTAVESTNIGWKRILKNNSNNKLKLVDQTLDEDLEKTNKMMMDNDLALKSFIEIKTELMNINLKET